MAEWIAWRLSQHTEEMILFNYIEASKAGVIDWDYIDLGKGSKRYTRLKKKEWKGNILGPMHDATEILIDALYNAKRSMSVAEYTVYMANLTEYILPDKVPQFREWRNFVITRFTELDPLDLDNPFGNAIPSEALDPTIKFKPSMSKKLLQAFVENLEFENNPCLKTPQRMIDDGFEGSPYKF